MNGGKFPFTFLW